MKKITALVLTIFLLFNFALMAHATEEDTLVMEEIIEDYTNTSSVLVSLSISSSGTATIGITCIGMSGTTHISSTTYLEKWSGTSWVRVSINGANQINDGANGGYLLKTYTTTVGSGKFRATAVFTVTNGSNETVTIRSNTATH